MRLRDIPLEYETPYPPTQIICFSEKAVETVKLKYGLKVKADTDPIFGWCCFWTSEETRSSISLIYINLARHEALRYQHPRNSVITTLVHESQHALQDIETHIGERLSAEGEAYLVELLFQRAYDRYQAILTSEKKK